MTRGNLRDIYLNIFNYACILVQHLSPWCIFGSYLTGYGIFIEHRYASEMFCFMTYRYQLNISHKTCQMAKSVVCICYMKIVDDICYRYSHYFNQNRVSVYSCILHYVYSYFVYGKEMYTLSIFDILSNWCQQNLKCASEMVSIL